MKFIDALNDSEKPKASVIVISYNNSAHIKHCLDRILNQDVTFSCELVLCDDYSSDDTTKIINNMIPDLRNVRKHFSSENLYTQSKLWSEHMFNTLSELKGDVFFWVDGDDYWSEDSSRIQKMAKTLLTDLSLSMCFSDTLLTDEINPISSKFILPESLKKTIPVDQLRLLGYSNINLGAACFRNVNIQWPEEYLLQFNSDTWWPFLWSDFGPAKYQADCGFLTYRVHSEGAWSATSKEKKQRNKLIFACQLISHMLKTDNLEGAKLNIRRLLPLMIDNPYIRK